ncbi:hypothetical protein [Eikenella glucosivorans]|nr:hypothetical protein [Eikenella glucosivorans]
MPFSCLLHKSSRHYFSFAKTRPDYAKTSFSGSLFRPLYKAT